VANGERSGRAFWRASKRGIKTTNILSQHVPIGPVALRRSLAGLFTLRYTTGRHQALGFYFS
jgi:hypothetical protein